MNEWVDDTTVAELNRQAIAVMEALGVNAAEAISVLLVRLSATYVHGTDDGNVEMYHIPGRGLVNVWWESQYMQADDVLSPGDWERAHIGFDNIEWD